MGRIEKTVFISYRRTNVSWALAISQNLTQSGFDVFFDFTGIASGDFERVILENIRARAHFLVLLTPSALERCGDPTDWLRREIETALGARRNVVPLMLEGFDFGTPAIANHLAGKLAGLKKYNALSIPPEYFVQAMERLRDEFLKVPLDAVLHPASQVAQQAATEQKDAAAKAPAVAEEELVEKEREQAAAEKARLEQLQRDHKTSEEEASLADVKSRRATARQFHLVRARKPTPEVIGPLTRKYPAWMKVGIAVGAVLLIGSLLYWAASRSGDKGSEAQKPETQATPNQVVQPQTITLPQTAALTCPWRILNLAPFPVHSEFW